MSQTSGIARPTQAPVSETHAWTGKQLVIVLVIGLAALVVSLTQSLLIPVMSELGTELDASADGVAWIFTSTLLVGAVAVPTFGRLGDLYGTRRMLLVALITLVVGSLICAVADNLAMMIVGRAVVGLAAAAIPLSISLVGVILPREHAGAGIALISAMLGVGGALGLPLAGLVAQYADYHLLFWICIIGGAVVYPLILRLVPEPARDAEGRMDVPGTLLLGAAMPALLLPLAQGQSWGWTDPLTLGLFATAVVLLTGFVLLELRRTSPLVDVRTSARRPVLLTNLASVCVGFTLFASLIGTASYVQAPAISGYGFGSSILAGGLCMLPGGLMMLVLSLASSRLNARTALAVGALVIAVGFATRIVLAEHMWQVVAGNAIVGAGIGMAYAAMPGLIMHATPRSELAAANGLNTLFRSVGSSLASAIGGAILAAQTIDLAGHTLPSLSAYRLLFVICATVAVLAALLALAIPRSSNTADAVLTD
ncbi:MFS transporter [Streptomyces sp. NPDC002623]